MNISHVYWIFILWDNNYMHADRSRIRISSKQKIRLSLSVKRSQNISIDSVIFFILLQTSANTHILWYIITSFNFSDRNTQKIDTTPLFITKVAQNWNAIYSSKFLNQSSYIGHTYNLLINITDEYSKEKKIKKLHILLETQVLSNTYLHGT